MESWQRVEVAACEELARAARRGRGADGERARGDPHGALHGRRRRRARAGHRSRRGRLRRRARRLGGRGGAVDPLRADLLGRARHGARAAAARGRRGDRRRAHTGSWRRCTARAREHVQTLCVGRTHGVHAEPTTFGVKLAGFAFEAHRNALRLQRAFEQVAVGAVSGAVGTYAATSPDFEMRVLARLGLQREDVSTQVVAARPPRRAARGDRAGRRRAGALRDGDPPPAAHGGARGAGAVPRRARRAPRRCRTSATRSRPSRSRASHACCAATRRRRSRTWRCGTSATSRTPRSSA